jgi:Leucine Rich repeat
MNGMPDAAPKPTTTPKTRRRWFRFSLRTMLLAVTLFCAWLGVTFNRANRQKHAVETITSHGGQVNYDYEADEDGRFVQNPPPPPGPDWLRNLIGTDYFATVVDVGIDYQKGVNDDAVEALADLPQLRRLHLHGIDVTDSVLARLTRLTQLHILALTNSSVTDAGCEPLKRLTRLKELGLVSRCISDGALEHIEGLTRLTGIVLRAPQVTDFGLVHLKRLACLEALDLTGNDKITDVGLQHLKSLVSLRLLCIRATSVTADGVKQLKRALPNLTVNGP